VSGRVLLETDVVQNGGPLRPTVLVVEDEFLISLELEILLEGHGWDVIGPVRTVREAVFILGDERPSVAVLDVLVADGHVGALAERLQQLDVPFVLSTGLHAVEVERLHEALAGAPLASKPVNWTSLGAALADVAPQMNKLQGTPPPD